MTLCLCLCHLCWAEVMLSLCLCLPCWAEVTWGTRSHHHVTASATSPSLLWLQGTAWTCCCVGHRRALWHGTRWPGRDSLCPPQSLGRKHIPCSIFPPRLEPTVQSVLWIVASTFQGQPKISLVVELFSVHNSQGKQQGWCLGYFWDTLHPLRSILFWDFFF